MINKDFTLDIYRKLLCEFSRADYFFLTFEDLMSRAMPSKKTIILRHDVDRRPENALMMAQLENEYGIKASYYFRIVKQSNSPDIIKKISKLGHEIGYHYEDLSIAKGDYNKAIELFKTNLDYFRQFYPIKTVCMHGSPLSKYDNRLIRKRNDYRDYGIIGEPYFDIDFENVAYLTDTSRKWNSSNENIRDKVKTNFSFDFKSTFKIINAVNNNEIPDIIMLNIHPQRWHMNIIRWSIELVSQICKNIIKRLINKHLVDEKSPD